MRRKWRIRPHRHPIAQWKGEKSFQIQDGMLLPLKVHSFRSLQMVHIRQSGIAHRISTAKHHPKPPFQHANNSTTCLGITQETPYKKKTKEHRLDTWVQWISKWSTDYSLHWHMQHQLTKQIFHLFKVSRVRIFPLVAVQVEKHHPWRNSRLPHASPFTKGKNDLHRL